MMKIKVTIHTKIILLLMGITLVLGFSAIVFVKGFISVRLTTELKERGLSIGRNFASNCIEPLLVNDLVKIQKLASNIKQSEKDVGYVFILNGQNVPVVHTFGNYFPKGLVEAVSGVDAGIGRFRPLDEPKGSTPEGSTPYRDQLLNTEQGLIRDIALPILSGRLGTVHIGVSEKRIQEDISSIVNRLTGAMGIIMFLGVGLTYVFARRVLLPLREVAMSIKKIGEGDFNQKIDLKSKDEIKLLADTFNEMVEKLEKTNLELKNAQSQLIQTAKMATMGQFSAGIAHEINNPLAGILNCVRSLLGDPGIKGQRKGYLELTLKGLLRIENTIGQILSFSGRREFKPRLTDINQLIKESLTFTKHRLIEQKIIFQQNLDDSLAPILVDPHQLQQVFMNIIGNALDAMSNGGSLTIKTEYQQKSALKSDAICISFIDNGKGIKEEDLDKIFDPFYTAKKVGKGVGLGLSISYTIIQQHKGTIDIKSKENKGTIVTITLPIKE